MNTGLVVAVMLGVSFNTLVVAALIVWLSRGGGNVWINDLNANNLSVCISLFVILETAGAVLGGFMWAQLGGHVEPMEKSLGYLGIWFGFLGTHVLANGGVQIGKRLTDGTYTEKKGEANAKVEAAKATVPEGLVAGIGAAVAAKVEQAKNGIITTEHPAGGGM